jgi:hypothetical protein
MNDPIAQAYCGGIVQRFAPEQELIVKPVPGNKQRALFLSGRIDAFEYIKI